MYVGLNGNDSSNSGTSSENNQQLKGIGDYVWDIPGWDFDEFGSGTNSSEYITNNKIFCYPIKVNVQKTFIYNSNWQDLNVSLRIGIFTFGDGFPGRASLNTTRLGSMNLTLIFLSIQAAILLV